MGNGRFTVMLAAAGLGLAVLAPLAAQAAQPAGAAGAAASHPGASLVAVSCPAAKFCLAVGSRSAPGGRRSLAEEWNGKAWRPVASAPGRGLVGVSCTSTWFCMVTVESGTSTAPESVQIFNGRTWRAAARPADPTSAISCASRRLCMVLDDSTTVESWNGTRWRTASGTNICELGPPGGGCHLTALSCANAHNCMATGEASTDDNGDLGGFAFPWNGTNWGLTQTPYDFAAPSVSCAGSDFCLILPWASYNAQSESWTTIPACTQPNCGLGLLLSCASDRFCMTVFDPDRVATIWNGTSFTKTSLLPVTGASQQGLPGLSCQTATNCMAVGGYTKNSKRFTLAELWNGTKWEITKMPSPV